jgi:hypothetical protein
MAWSMTSTPPLGSPPGSSEGSRQVSPTHATSNWPKRWLVFAIGVAVVALAYGVGRFQGALALTAADRQSAKDRGAAQASLAACQTDRGLLAARRSLSLVALSLDRRNFGVAEKHRQDALHAFEQPSVRGVAAVPELLATVRGLNLAVDPDPGAKRDQVIAVSEALDRLVATPAGKPTEPATAH